MLRIDAVYRHLTAGGSTWEFAEGIATDLTVRVGIYISRQLKTYLIKDIICCFILYEQSRL